MMLTDNDFKLKQEVYLKTDTDQFKRFVTGILIRPNGISYELTCGESASWHYDFEIAIEKDVLITSSN